MKQFEDVKASLQHLTIEQLDVIRTLALLWKGKKVKEKELKTNTLKRV